MGLEPATSGVTGRRSLSLLLSKPNAVAVSDGVVTQRHARARVPRPDG